MSPSQRLCNVIYENKNEERSGIWNDCIHTSGTCSCSPVKVLGWDYGEEWAFKNKWLELFVMLSRMDIRTQTACGSDGDKWISMPIATLPTGSGRQTELIWQVPHNGWRDLRQEYRIVKFISKEAISPFSDARYTSCWRWNAPLEYARWQCNGWGTASLWESCWPFYRRRYLVFMGAANQIQAVFMY